MVMGVVRAHPRRAAGQAAIVDRLHRAVRALRDDGIESLVKASRALRRLPDGALTGAADEMAREIDRAIAELSAVSGDGAPMLDAIRGLERRLTALHGRLAAARGAGEAG